MNRSQAQQAQLQAARKASRNHTIIATERREWQQKQNAAHCTLGETPSKMESQTGKVDNG